ncbi:unnamed protein product [Brassicogethes aeneus]|uniref:Neuromodulin n=1 Tax=Brassicogethes aeneus TaxID=1431903 RepID=A0A9P0AR86_BRAAE|nr:unnamed protein product [Brassicogethes aeneus]
MGCNTSKESVPVTEEEKKNKEIQENYENKTEEDNNETNKDSDTKSCSAKTITLCTNGSAKVLQETTPPAEPVVDKQEPAPPADQEPEQEVEEAATKIQAAFRGHRTRKSMKQPAQQEQQQEAEPTREELEQEFRADDEELCHAATKIQASFRGHMSRKQQDDGKNNGDEGNSSAKSKDQKLEEEELDIDLTDPELNKAAVKIQASFRGHMTRKEDGKDTTGN